eukprot:1324141-Amorphochlora_amoeboformis.AAC.1
MERVGSTNVDVTVVLCHAVVTIEVTLNNVFKGLDTCIVMVQVVTWGSEDIPGFRGFRVLAGNGGQ